MKKGIRRISKILLIAALVCKFIPVIAARDGITEAQNAEKC